MLELFPEGFEEREDGAGVELAAYTDPAGEARARAAFGDITAVDVAEGWEDRWRDFHRGVTIGPLWVGPPWERPPGDLLAVVIEPGRAFGTGAHPTTRLCLELLAELPPGSLLDVGCGSGRARRRGSEARLRAGAGSRPRSGRRRDDDRERSGERRRGRCSSGRCAVR